jgi:hypothetical protein
MMLTCKATIEGDGFFGGNRPTKGFVFEQFSTSLKLSVQEIEGKMCV